MKRSVVTLCSVFALALALPAWGCKDNEKNACQKACDQIRSCGGTLPVGFDCNSCSTASACVANCINQSSCVQILDGSADLCVATNCQGVAAKSPAPSERRLACATPAPR